MNSYGEKIAGLRKDKGWTQAELGDKLNVTFQAVSKWERGESLPDFDTMSRISALFGVPLSYFQADGEAAVPEPEPEPAQPQRVMLGCCKTCGAVVYEGDEGRKSPELVCKKCVAREQAAQSQAAAAKAQAEAAKIRSMRKRGLIGLIVGAIVAVVAVAADLGTLAANGKMDLWYTAFAAILLFTCVSQLVWGGAVREVFTFGFGKAISWPGLIFEWSFDGIMWLIGMKILFWILGVIFGIVVALFFMVISLLISPFTFVFRLVQVMSGKESDYE